MESRGGGISNDTTTKKKEGFGELQCGKGGKQRNRQQNSKAAEDGKEKKKRGRGTVK